MSNRISSILLLVAVLGTAACSSSQQVATPVEALQSATKKDTSDKDKLKPYSEIVTDEMQSDSGLFHVHLDGKNILYEIPDSLFEKEMLLVSRIARTANNIGYGGEKSNTQVVRWQKRDNDVLLRIVSYENTADEDDPIFEAVRNANFETILKVFEVKSLSQDSLGVVVDVTDLYSGDTPGFGLSKSRRDRYKVRRLDNARSFVSGAKSFPKNIEVQAVLTYEATEPPSNSSTGTISVEMNHSMIMLPEDPMQPRHCDRRVGYFSVRTVNYGLDNQKAEEECYITRWRLEPSDPEAFSRGELVEPVKPIVYYIDPSTPVKWRPYLKQGVQDWNVAFEKAGFKNAVIAKDPPTPEEDPEFSPEDIRYSVIRYFPSEIANAYGPHVHDPRSGEILESDIGWFHNVTNLLRNWFFVQTAAVNPEARKVEFDDEVMGRLVRFVSAHEVGHTIGLPHNWGSSAAYPVDSLRSPAFTQKMGTAPSIMDYARFNYVAQPGDGDVGLMPDIGPYDLWSVEWGYRPILDAASAEAERDVLNGWVTSRADDPLYFYGAQTGSRVDPRSQNEDLGDDAVKASEYGLANLKRIMPRLVEWTSEEGKDYDDLVELHGQVIGQWNRYMGHVARNIGGMYETHKTYDQSGVVYEPVPAARQKESMQFLVEEALVTPTWLLNADLIRRVEGSGMVDRVRRLQAGVVSLVLSAPRMARMIEIDAIHADETYDLLSMLGDLRKGIFSELPNGAVDPFRRNLQRAYVERLEYLMTEEYSAPTSSFLRDTPVDISQSDIRPFVRGELEALAVLVARGERRVRDRPTKLHLKDLGIRIAEILDPKD